MTNEPNLVEEKRAEYARILNQLIQAARLDGFVLEIEVIPMNPPRMGNYALVGYVHLGNELYRGGK